MYRTRLPHKARTEDLEHFVHRKQNSPQAPDVFAIVGSVHLVLVEWDGIGHFYRQLPDLYLDTQRSQRGHQFVIEIGHRTWSESDGRGARIRGANDQLALNEVELHVEVPSSVRN